MSSLPAPGIERSAPRPAPDRRRSGTTVKAKPAGADSAAQVRSVLIVVPGLDGGAADSGAVELVRILSDGGYRPTVAARAGRLVADVRAAGGEFIALDTATRNPFLTLRNAAVLTRFVREHRCVAVHALGRASAWSAYAAARLTGVPFLTSWYKGFRQQNIFKRLYNGILARGDRVIAVSEQLAHLINERYGTPWSRIAVVPVSVDLDQFNPAQISAERLEAVRRAWGVTAHTKVILVTGRILRRKGHHVVVRAVKRLKERGLKNFLCVFVGEDRGRTHYTGELWDLVLASGGVDVIRMAAPVTDMAAAYAAASVVVSAAVQPEGLQRALVEAQAMARPVIVSDLGAGSDVVLVPPIVPDDRITGLRFASNDDAALAATLLRLFAMPEPIRRSIGQRGRRWVLDHFNAETVAAQTLQLYAAVTTREPGQGASKAVEIKAI